MQRARTRGQPAALDALDAMRRGRLAHAILLVGPPGSGKTTLALDFAAALLCQVQDVAERPCRACRACRMVDGGNHPDLHRLAPGGPGAQIGIGGPDRPRGVRDLVSELALLPVEGGLRVAIVEEAHRLNDDAQSALLKTLEEPPAGVVLILCADEEERLLPTVRSRCARIRLRPVPTRDIEAWLVELGAADAPRSARLARIAMGRPGLALAYARAPEAEAARAEIARQLLDLLRARPSAALGAARDLLGRSLDLARALDASPSPAARSEPFRTARGGSSPARRPRAALAVSPSPLGEGHAGGPAANGGGNAADVESPQPALPDEPETLATAGRLTPQDRRRAALTLLRVWQDVARDLALVEVGEARRARDPSLLDELEAAAARIEAERPGHSRSFLPRLARTAELIEGNVAPDLAIDVLVLAWRQGSAPPSPA